MIKRACHQQVPALASDNRVKGERQQPTNHAHSQAGATLTLSDSQQPADGRLGAVTPAACSVRRVAAAVTPTICTVQSPCRPPVTRACNHAHSHTQLLPRTNDTLIEQLWQTSNSSAISDNSLTTHTLSGCAAAHAEPPQHAASPARALPEPQQQQAPLKRPVACLL